MNKLYSLLFGVMLATQASAQVVLDATPGPNVPEGYRLEFSQIEYWHPRVDNGQHVINGKSYYLYDDNGREYLRLDYDNVDYIDHGDYYEQYRLDEFYVAQEKRSYYTEKGQLKCESYHTFSPIDKDWTDEYALYTDFDETTGQPASIYYCKGKYEEGSDDVSSAMYKVVVEKYHGSIPEKAYLDLSTDNRKRGYTWQREFNDWGGISKEVFNYQDINIVDGEETEYSYSEESTFAYDEHNNLLEHGFWATSSSGNEESHTQKYVNEYDENGLLLSALARPYSSYVSFSKVSYTWSKFDNPAGISKMSVADFVNDKWYDISGRRLAQKPDKPGLYIRNGKKMVIR